MLFLGYFELGCLFRDKHLAAETNTTVTCICGQTPSIFCLTSMLGSHVQTDNLVYDKHMRLVRSLPVGASRNGQDRDHVVELCDEVVKDGHSCLIFCPTKKNCEVGAHLLSKKISPTFPGVTFLRELS